MIVKCAKEITCRTADLTRLGQQRGSKILDELRFETILASRKTIAWISETKMIRTRQRYAGGGIVMI